MTIKYRTQLGDLLRHFHLKGPACEIGVAEGRNAEVLISQKEITKLYLIDAWTRLNQSGDGGNDQRWHDNNYIEANDRVSKFKEKAVFLKGMSSEMIKQIPDKSLVLAYIDGDHTYNGCFTDLVNIFPKIRKGGILAGHDYLNLKYGVHNAVNDFAIEKGLTVNVIEEDEVPMAGFWIRL